MLLHSLISAPRMVRGSSRMLAGAHSPAAGRLWGAAAGSRGGAATATSTSLPHASPNSTTRGGLAMQDSTFTSSSSSSRSSSSSGLSALGGAKRPAQQLRFFTASSRPAGVASAPARATATGSAASLVGVLSRPRGWLSILQGCWSRQVHWWQQTRGCGPGGADVWGNGGRWGEGLVLPFPVDTCEDESAYLIFGDLPGVARADIEITTSGQQIVINARRERPTSGGGSPGATKTTTSSSNNTSSSSGDSNSGEAASSTLGQPEPSAADSDEAVSSASGGGSGSSSSSSSGSGQEKRTATNEVIGSVLSATTPAADGPTTNTGAATHLQPPHTTTTAADADANSADGQPHNPLDPPPPPPPPSPLKPRRRERVFGRLRRRLIFPQDADLSASTAVLKDGVLRVTIPKRRHGGAWRRTVPIE